MTDFKRTLRVKLVGKDYDLTARFSALREIESLCKATIGELSKRVVENRVGIEMYAAIFYGGLVGSTPKDQEPSISFEDCGDLIIQHGLNGISADLIDFLLMCVKKDPTLDKVIKKPKAPIPAEKKT